jgi:hypothetical protein
VGAKGNENGISIRRCARCLAGCDVSAGPWYVLDIERLSQLLAQFLGSEPREQVGRTARRERHYHAYRPRRIGLRESDTRDDRQRGRARGQMQDVSPVGKFQRRPSLSRLPHSRKASVRAPWTATRNGELAISSISM